MHVDLKVGNPEIILTSELYQQNDSALRGIESVRTNSAEDAGFERKTAKNGEYVFVLTASQRRAHRSQPAVQGRVRSRNGIKSVKTAAPSATVKEI